MDADGQAGGALTLGKRLERGKAERWLHVRAARLGGRFLSQRSDERVDLAERLARHLLDRLEGGLRALRVLRAEQPCGAGVDEDDVDRMACRVVEVARDPGALLRRGEAAFLFGVALGSAGTLLELGDSLATQAHAVPRTHAPPHTSAPARTGAVGNSSSAMPVVVTWTAKSTATTPPVTHRGARVLSGLRARKYRATVGPSGGPGGYPRPFSAALAAAVTTKTASGALRRATSGSEANAAR